MEREEIIMEECLALEHSLEETVGFQVLERGIIRVQAAGTMKSLGEAPDASELSGFFSGFKTIGTAISGICAITALIYFVINLTKFSTSAGNDMQRARALKGLLFSGVSLALFGGITVIAGVFWNAI